MGTSELLAPLGPLALLLTAAACAPAGGRAPTLHLSAAASLRELVDDVERAWAEPRGVELLANVAGSGTLARQIEAGARCDLFLSADGPSIERAGLDPDAALAIAGNRMALLVRPGASPELRGPGDLAAHAQRVAVAGPAVPAGAYARELLNSLGALDELEGRLVNADDVRGALGLVEAGAVDAALVYATDAALAREAELRWTAGAGEGPRVELFAALRAEGARPPEGALPSVGDGAELAAELLEWLGGEEFRGLARARGFTAVEAGAEVAGSTR